jgi:hypothetical protein
MERWRAIRSQERRRRSIDWSSAIGWLFWGSSSSIPQRGGTKAPEREAYEKTREFKDGQRFRAGIEGRISVLFRGRGMKRCLAEGRERFELWVAAAVLANNLLKIAALLTTGHCADESPPDNIPSVLGSWLEETATSRCNHHASNWRFMKSRWKSRPNTWWTRDIERQFAPVLLRKWHPPT